MAELCFPTSLPFPWADFSHQTITTPGAGSASSFGLHQDTITALIICLAILFLVTLVTVFLFIRACRRRRSRVADMSVRIVRESDMDEGGWNNAYGYGLSGGASRAVSPYSVGAGSKNPGGGPVSPRSSTCWTGSEEQHEEGKSGTYSDRFSASGTSTELSILSSSHKLERIATEFLTWPLRLFLLSTNCRHRARIHDPSPLRHAPLQLDRKFHESRGRFCDAVYAQ